MANTPARKPDLDDVLPQNVPAPKRADASNVEADLKPDLSGKTPSPNPRKTDLEVTTERDGSPKVVDPDAPKLEGTLSSTPLYDADREKRAADTEAALELAGKLGVGPLKDGPQAPQVVPTIADTPPPSGKAYVGRDVLYTHVDGEERTAKVVAVEDPSMQFPAGHVTLAVPGIGDVRIVQPSTDGLSQRGRYRLGRG